MKCPLFRAALIAAIGKDLETLDDCLKEECACWDVNDQLCCLRTLTESAYFIHGDLREIRDKMPHAGQFTKYWR